MTVCPIQLEIFLLKNEGVPIKNSSFVIFLLLSVMIFHFQVPQIIQIPIGDLQLRFDPKAPRLSCGPRGSKIFFSMPKISPSGSEKTDDWSFPGSLPIFLWNNHTLW